MNKCFGSALQKLENVYTDFTPRNRNINELWPHSVYKSAFQQIGLLVSLSQASIFFSKESLLELKKKILLAQLDKLADVSTKPIQTNKSSFNDSAKRDFEKTENSYKIEIDPSDLVGIKIYYLLCLKDVLCSIAYGTYKVKYHATNLMFRYWPKLNPNKTDRNIHYQFIGEWLSKSIYIYIYIYAAFFLKSGSLVKVE